MADWDSVSIDYNRIFLENPLYVDTLRSIVELIEVSPCREILDIGCGTGNAIAAVLQRFPDARVTGVDTSRGMLEVCAERFGEDPRVSLTSADALSLPFEKSSFDCAVSNLALHHVIPEERLRCAREIARVLRKGGTLVYGDIFLDVEGEEGDPGRCRDIINKIVGSALYCLDHGAFDMMLLLLEALPQDIKAEGEYLATPGEWIEHLRKAGFDDFSVTCVIPEDLGIKVIRARLPE